MSRKLTTAEFIERCIAKHGNKFDYTKTTYVDQKTKVTITCPMHGDWECMPMNHTFHGNGCPSCGIRQRSADRTTSHDDFVAIASQLHAGKYTYPSQYINSQTKIDIVCPVHGLFKMKPNAHTSGKQGCPQCANKHKSNQQWIDDFVATHGDVYDYTNTVITKAHEKTTIRCKRHGEFKQTPAMHKSGQGCPQCGYTNHKGRYSEEYFDRHPDMKNHPAKLYALQYSNEFEHFIKIGITTTSVDDRIRNSGKVDYTITKLGEKSCPLLEAFRTEQQLLDIHSEHKYNPSQRISGRTECLLPCVAASILTIINGDTNVQ